MCWPTTPGYRTCPGIRLLVTPLRNTDTSSPSRYQSQTASWLGGTLCPLYLLLDAGILSDLNLCNLCACHHSACSLWPLQLFSFQILPSSIAYYHDYASHFCNISLLYQMFLKLTNNKNNSLARHDGIGL